MRKLMLAFTCVGSVMYSQVSFADTFSLHLTSVKNADVVVTVANPTSTPTNPGKWSTASKDAFGVALGSALIVQGVLQLKTDDGYSISLYGFDRGPKKGDQGTGSKETNDGNFPYGKFNWKCVNRK